MVVDAVECGPECEAVHGGAGDDERANADTVAAGRMDMHHRSLQGHRLKGPPSGCSIDV